MQQWPNPKIAIKYDWTEKYNVYFLQVALEFIQPRTEMGITNISWVVKAAGA